LKFGRIFVSVLVPEIFIPKSKKCGSKRKQQYFLVYVIQIFIVAANDNAGGKQKKQTKKNEKIAKN